MNTTSNLLAKQKLSRVTKIFTGVLGIGVVMASASAEDTLYRNTFGWETTEKDPNGWGINTQISKVGWAQYNTRDAKPDDAYSVNPPPGLPQDVDNVNTAAPSLSKEHGYIRIIMPPHEVVLACPNDKEVEAFSSVDLDPAHYKTLSFRWSAGTQETAVSQRLAVKIGDNWYVTDQAIQHEIGWKPFDLNAEPQTVEFSPEGAKWRDLAFTPGGELQMAEAARTEKLPSGPITNFGIFSESVSDSGNVHSYFDTFEVVGMK